MRITQRGPVARGAVKLLTVCIRAYRFALSPWLGSVCRYQPTCSSYALTAVETHGPVYGSVLALKRILRCHPWGGAGYDPVPRRDVAPPDSAGENR